MIRPSAVALGVLLVLPFTPTAAQVSYEPIVDVPGVVDIRWRTVIDRLGRQSHLPYFYRASPDDTRRAQQVLAVDREYRRAEAAADISTADRILASTFIGLDEKGRTANKSETLARLRQMASDPVDINRATVRFSEKIAVLTGEQVRRRAGEDGPVLFAHVYVEIKPGSWELVSSTRFHTH
jgi:hypothetical protein